jgi:hypothetical protein
VVRVVRVDGQASWVPTPGGQARAGFIELSIPMLQLADGPGLSVLKTMSWVPEV